MSVSFDFEKILSSVVEKAKKDNIITQEEQALLRSIRLEGEDIQNKIEQLKTSEKESALLQKLLANSSRIMLKNLVSKAREDGKISHDEKQILETLFKELGFDLNNFNSRPWFVFKICLNINEKTPMNELLGYFDKIFCLRGIDPNEVYSGLCLGTKHFVIEDVDVTLLSFAITPDNTQSWVEKGAFATIDFSPNFDRVLYNTANDLIIENYINKIL